MSTAGTGGKQKKAAAGAAAGDGQQRTQGEKGGSTQGQRVRCRRTFCAAAPSRPVRPGKACRPSRYLAQPVGVDSAQWADAVDPLTHASCICTAGP